MNKSPKLIIKPIYILIAVVLVLAIALSVALIHDAHDKLRQETIDETLNRVLVELNYFEEEIRSSIPKDIPQIPDPIPEEEEIPETTEPDSEPIEEDILDEVIEPDPIPESAPEPEPDPEPAPVETTQVVTNELIDSYIYEICENYYPNIDPYIIRAQVYTESTYNPNAYNPNGGSIGLMQIIPRWHNGRMERLGTTDLYDAYQNLMVGIDYMNELYEMKNDIAFALMAFNMGPSCASSSYNSGNISWYASTIMARADTLRGESNA